MQISALYSLPTMDQGDNFFFQMNLLRMYQVNDFKLSFCVLPKAFLMEYLD